MDDKQVSGVLLRIGSSLSHKPLGSGRMVTLALPDVLTVVSALRTTGHSAPRSAGLIMVATVGKSKDEAEASHRPVRPGYGGDL